MPLQILRIVNKVLNTMQRVPTRAEGPQILVARARERTLVPPAHLEGLVTPRGEQDGEDEGPQHQGSKGTDKDSKVLDIKVLTRAYNGFTLI